MAKRRSIDFLPSVFRTKTNQRFLNATVDQLIQEPSLKKIYGYIGQQDQSTVFRPSDYYINENDSYSQFYQLEPGVVIKKKQKNSNTYTIDNIYNYPDLLNQLVSSGAITNDHQRLFANRYYSYNGFIDLDKLTNYRQYYWVPNGPLPVDVTASGVSLIQEFNVHRVSDTANNQTELQSASIGQSGYSIDGYSNTINPTIILQRGGRYTFNLGQVGHKFYIQSEIGTSGVSSVQANISTRNVLGVSNNGADSGNLIFNVPLKTAQDSLISLDNIQNIDMIVHVPYNAIQGQNYDRFILNYSLDGVKAFSTSNICIDWPFNDGYWLDVPLSQQTGIWQLTIDNNKFLPDGVTDNLNYRNMSLAYLNDWLENTKTFVTQGDKYGHTYVYRNSNGVITQFPTITAPLSTLYYQDADNPLIYGEIRLVDPDPASFLNINDIIGHDQYTSPNGVKFSSGLKVKFTGVTYPTEYQNNEYIVEGVGNSIKLLKYNDLVTPETINQNSGDQFGSDTVGFDDDNFDGTTNSPTQKDYITINRSSIDGNSWSRNNRWFHREVLQYAADKTNQIWTFDSVQQAQRPIVEFVPDLKLFDYGTNYAGAVTVFDSHTTDAFFQVEGQNNYALISNGKYFSDNILLQNGQTVIFVNDVDPIVRKTIYQVQSIRPRSAATYNLPTIAVSHAGTSAIALADVGNIKVNQRVTSSLIQQTQPLFTATANQTSFFCSSISNLGNFNDYYFNVYLNNVLQTNNTDYSISYQQSVYYTGLSLATSIVNITNLNNTITLPTIATTYATTVSGSNLISINSGSGIVNGQTISGNGIPVGTTVVSGGGTSALTLSNTCTLSAPSVVVTTFTNIQNGQVVVGTGFQNGTTVIDGGGTQTLLLSKVTTATATNVTINVYQPSTNYYNPVVNFLNKVVNSYSFISTAAQTAFDLVNTNILADYNYRYDVYVNGALKTLTSDYTVTTDVNGHPIINLNSAPTTGSAVVINYVTTGPATGASVLVQYIPLTTPILPNTTVTSVDTVNNIFYISTIINSDIAAGLYLTFDNSADQIHLVPLKQVSDGDNVVAIEGEVNQGNVFYYDSGTWNLAQIRNSRPQFPLFDIIDINGFSLSDTSVYPSSDFRGSQLFGYAVGKLTSATDTVLGFPLVRQSVGNIGDIVFDNYYISDTFNYNLNFKDNITNISTGFAASINSWKNYSFANGWSVVSDKSKQYITKVIIANDAINNNFDLGIVYKNSYYENNVFVYVNGILKLPSTYTLQTNKTNTFIKFNTNLLVGDRLFVKINGTSAIFKQNYTMPKNLTNNSENLNFNKITLGQVRNHLIEIGNNCLNLIGEPAGSNNFRDLNYSNIAGKLLQHSSSLRQASLLLANPDVDPVRAITYSENNYQNFKNQLIDLINTKEFPDPKDSRKSLDIVLSNFTQLTNSNSTFYYTDMLAFGNQYITNTYTIQDTTYRSFNLTNTYANKPSSYNSVLVYLTNNLYGTRQLLVNGVDYSINDFTVTIAANFAISRLDTIAIYEYTSTLGCNVPATPSKLGLYPKFVPQKILDNTYNKSQSMIVGHDGSYTLAWGDYRDDILLEYEKRVFNNIAVDYQNNSDYSLVSVVPGAFRATDYSITEWTQLLSGSYLSWSGQNNVDIFTNTNNTNSLFGFNYSQATDKLFGQTLPGYWRGIYNYFYDTDKPHTNPWEMLGFTEKPSWWDARYGVAPYTSQNITLWSDLELGLIYNGAPNKSYIDSKYTRTGLSQIIPVDDHGNLLAPLETLVAKYDSKTATDNWRVGDQSPQETAWRRSSSYPFAVQIAWFLAKPAEYCALNYNSRDVVFNTQLNQIINKKTNNRIFNYSVTDSTEFVPGLNVWLRDLLTSNNLDITTNWLDIANNSSFNLVYKMSGYTDKSYLTIVADQVSPSSTNNSVLIPPENYQIKVTKSAPIGRAIYSAVVVQKTATGYQVSGFDKNRPYFLTIPSKVSGNNYSITVGQNTGIIYNDSDNAVTSFPYGTIFSTHQQVVDFLISYGRYLINQGFIFSDILSDNQTISDWTLAAKEFLFWDQQNWGNNTVIGLTPTGTSVNYSNVFGVVDKIANDQAYTKVIDSDGTTLTGRDYRVYRDDNNFSISLKNSKKGIHLLDIIIVQYEHCLVFDNSTVFNDILYDEQVGSRQFRLRLDGVKTQDWNGSLYAPGFLINYSDIANWSSYTDYYTGDIILFKNQYYAARNFIPGSVNFNSTDWYKISGNLLSKQLIPNMTSGATQFTNFYDPDTTDLNTSAEIQSKHSTGFQDRQYFTNLGLDRTSQYKFYLGMLTQKGTQAVLNAFLRNQQKGIDSDITISEQWAIKLGNYGGTNNVDKLEFNIGNLKTINNQYLFEFINTNDTASADLNSVKPQNLLLAPTVYNPDIFAQTEYQKPIVATAGPVSITDVTASVYDINKIYNISNLSGILGESSKIWIAADGGNQWGVYRLTQPTKVTVIGVNQTGPSEITFTTDVPHGLNTFDYTMLKGAKIVASTGTSGVIDLSGFYRVSNVPNAVSFSVKIVNNTTISSGKLSALLFKLINVRFGTITDFANFTPTRGWQDSEIVYIDNGPKGYQVLKNTNSWQLDETRSPVFTQPSDLYGSSIKINFTQSFAAVGASGKNITGQVFIYGKNQQNVWQELGILTPESRSSGFGTSVDVNNNNIVAASAPSSNKGSVYTAIANSQAISINQIIHYDNIYVSSSTAFPTPYGNNSILIDSSYGFANFAKGMPVVGANIASGTVISNLVTGYPYNTINISSNLAVTGSTIASGANIAIYPTLTPNSSFGSSLCMSTDGNWMFVGEPTLQRVFVYKYQIVNPSTSYRVGDGYTTIFVYPPTAGGKNLGPLDIKVYVSGKQLVPYLDYIRTSTGDDSITFNTAPANGASIAIVYENYFQEVNQIVTDDPTASGFGSSVACSYDGREVIIGAPYSNSAFEKTYNTSGAAFVYERTAENFISDGISSTFNLSNAFVGSATITTGNVVTYPTVTVDGVTATSTFYYANNSVVLGSVPLADSIVAISTNQFIVTKIATADSGQVGSNFGQVVQMSRDAQTLYSSAPGWNYTSYQNGAVFAFVNMPKRYGIATGTNQNVNMTANLQLRINDFLVTFTGGGASQCVKDINSANIPGVTASLTSSGAVQIISNDQVAVNKLRLRNEYGNPLTAMGIIPWQLTQKLFSPIVQDSDRFGEKLKLSPDGKKLVIGTTLSNNKIVTSFDLTKTTFDIKTVNFIDTVHTSGSAHIFEYIDGKSDSITDMGSFVYAKLLSQPNISSLDKFSTGVDISDNFIFVGSPNSKILGNQTGAMYIYHNANSSPIWNTIREPSTPTDSRMIDRVYLYNSATSKLITDLPVIDILHNNLPMSAETYIDYIINYDPAVYSNVPSTVSFSYDKKNNWGDEKVGKLWWDTNSIKYYDNSYGTNLDKFNNWGQAFPVSAVSIYEWIESSILPKDWATAHPLNPPLYTVNDVYSIKNTVDPSTGLVVTKYYFWVRNSTRVDLNNIRPSAFEIQTAISQPRLAPEPFAAVISSNSIAIYNASNLIDIDTNLVIEYKNTIKPQLIHNEWTMFDDGTDLGIATEFINKISDSLVGQDYSGRIIPDPTLSIGQKYGMNIRPRQSLFNDQYTARKLYIEKLNEICLTYPMSLTRQNAISALNSGEAQPPVYTYKTSVANLTELSYLDANTYQADDLVLVTNDSTTKNGWSLYQLKVAFPNTRTWEIYQVQTYNLNNYWSYADWYSERYNPEYDITYTIDFENQISSLKLNVNDLIYIKNSNTGGWKIVLVKLGGLELLAEQNATIQFSNTLYDQLLSGQGFQTSSLETVGFANDANLEFSAIFGIVRDLLLTSEYRNSWKNIIRLMIDTIATQHLQTDWMMKTSFVDIYHRVRGLDPLPVYLPQPENIVTDFFNEVKPFHTKLKQYIAKYDNSNNIDYAYASLTDFDLQPYFNTAISKYRSPQLDNSLDTAAFKNQPLYQPWVNNHTYQVERIDVAANGTGYTGSTIVVIEGDGVGATAKAYILNTSVYTIEVTNPGSGYTYAVAKIYGLGSGAAASVILGNNLTRSFSTNIKFDRYTYFKNVLDWTANTSYAVDMVIVNNAEPYRVISAHTSETTFDFTKFDLLKVKVWYPFTEYAINDIVIYENASYKATTTFTSSELFDTTNLVTYAGLWLDNAADRIWAYYSPKSGMAGRDLAQLMIGMEYGGVNVKGPDFNQTPGFDVNNFDSIEYDLRTEDSVGVFDDYGNQAEDTYIQSSFTDTGLGLRPADIIILGGEFVDKYSSNAPEELVPGIVNDTLDIKVKTLPINAGSNDIMIFTNQYSSSGSFSFDPLVTGVSWPIGGIEKFFIIDRILGPIAEGVDYIVNWQSKTINLNYNANKTTFFYCIMMGSNGTNPIFDQDYIADGTSTDFVVPDNVLSTIQQAYVKVNGAAVSNWALVNKLLNGINSLVVRFDTAPVSGSYIQVHLYEVALGTRAYTEITEQTFITSSNPSYPADYNYNFINPEEYQQPLSAYSIVRLNAADLIPPQQSYYTGDAVTTTFSLTGTYIPDTFSGATIEIELANYVASISPTEILVVVDGVVQRYNVDYTISADGVAMPKVVFTAAPPLSSNIVISDSSNSDYKIYDSNKLTLNQNIVLNENSVITVLTRGNHDPSQVYTKIFSGNASNSIVDVDLGYDGIGFDDSGFDNELSTNVSNAIYTLPFAVTNINQIYVTLKAPQTTGGRPLIPYYDYNLISPTKLAMSNSLGLYTNSTIIVRIYGSTVRETTVEFRIFKDINNNTRYYAVRPSRVTRLSKILNPTDQWVYVESVANLQSPDPKTNIAGAILVDGERITYGVIDTINNRLGNIRRGTAGTGASIHEVGSQVDDVGSTLIIPNSADSIITVNHDTYITNSAGTNVLVPANGTLMQGQMFVATGESIQTSQSQQAQFIREL